MFVWVFHRVSGIVLIFLAGFKIYSGFGVGGALGEDAVPYWSNLHSNLAVDLIAILLFIYHSLYGLRTCLLDLGVKREKELFWGFSIVGIIGYILICFLWLF